MYSRKKYLKKKLKKLSPEEQAKELRRLILEDELAYWRARCLKAYRDVKNGE